MEPDLSRKSSKPFNEHNFQHKINSFYHLMKNITLAEIEASPEERRQIMAGKSVIGHSIYNLLTCSYCIDGCYYLLCMQVLQITRHNYLSARQKNYKNMHIT